MFNQLGVLELNIRTLKIFGFWPLENFSWHTNLLLAILHNLIMMTDVISAAGAIGYQCWHGVDDINIVVETAIAMADLFGYYFIYFCFFFNYKDIRQIIDDIKMFLRFCTPEIIEEADKEFAKYTKWMLQYFSFGLFFNSLMPMVFRNDCIKSRLSDYYRRRDPCGMPTRKWYPFDADTPTVFPFVFLLNLICCSWVIFGVLAVTTVLAGILMHIIAQIRNCRKFLLQSFDESSSQEQMENKLNFAIEYHITIIAINKFHIYWKPNGTDLSQCTRYTNRVYAAFNTMLFVHVYFTSSILGVLGYQVVIADNFHDQARYMMHLGGWIALLFLISYFGQRILTESATIAEAAYNSRWYNGPDHLKKSIVLMIMRAQKPLTLRAASVGVISLQNFISIIKTGYSYFALLVSITD